jgi:hypothetical protein
LTQPYCLPLMGHSKPFRLQDHYTGRGDEANPSPCFSCLLHDGQLPGRVIHGSDLPLSPNLPSERHQRGSPPAHTWRIERDNGRPLAPASQFNITGE